MDRCAVNKDEHSRKSHVLLELYKISRVLVLLSHMLFVHLRPVKVEQVNQDY